MVLTTSVPTHRVGRIADEAGFAPKNTSMNEPAIEKSADPVNEAPPIRAMKDARLGLMLLLANLFLQLVIGFASPLWQSGPIVQDEKVVRRTPGLDWYILTIGNTLLTLVPGSLLLYRAARTRRWKSVLMLILLAVGMEIAFLAGMAMIRPHGMVLDGREPLRVRLLGHLLDGLHWMELWCVAVLLAEVFLWRKQQAFVERTEALGYVLMAGFAASMLWVAWTITSPANLNDPDPISFVLSLGGELLNVFALFGTARLLLYGEGLLRYQLTQAGATPARKTS